MSQREEQVGRQAWPPQVPNFHSFLTLKFTDSHLPEAPLGTHSLSFFREILESGAFWGLEGTQVLEYFHVPGLCVPGRSGGERSVSRIRQTWIWIPALLDCISLGKSLISLDWLFFPEKWRPEYLIFVAMIFIRLVLNLTVVIGSLNLSGLTHRRLFLTQVMS